MYLATQLEWEILYGGAGLSRNGTITVHNDIARVSVTYYDSRVNIIF